MNLKTTIPLEQIPEVVQQKLLLIVAISKNNIIGNNGQIPWYYPEDLKYFKNLTTNYPIIMGRITFDSIIKKNKKPLKDRLHIVLTKNPDFNNKTLHNVLFINDIFKFLNTTNTWSKTYPNYSFSKIWVIGGSQIYSMLMKFCNKLYITRINEDHKGDTYFPKLMENEWKLISKTHLENNPLSFEVYQRTKRE